MRITKGWLRDVRFVLAAGIVLGALHAEPAGAGRILIQP